MTSVVAIDPNVRVRGNDTYAGFEDIDGPISVGLDVKVIEPEGGLAGTGRVTEIDATSRLVYLSVDWASLQPVALPEPFAPPHEVAASVFNFGYSTFVFELGPEMPLLAGAMSNSWPRSTGQTVYMTLPGRWMRVRTESPQEEAFGLEQRVETIYA